MKAAVGATLTEKLAHELYIERMTRCRYKIWFNREHVCTVYAHRDRAVRRACTIAINHHATPTRISAAYRKHFGRDSKSDVGGRWLLLELLEKAGYEGTAKLLSEENHHGS